MKDPHPNPYDSFPMQAALGLYSLHKHPPKVEEVDYIECFERRGRLQWHRNEESNECTVKKTKSDTTKDTKH